MNSDRGAPAVETSTQAAGDQDEGPSSDSLEGRASANAGAEPAETAAGGGRPGLRGLLQRAVERFRTPSDADAEARLADFLETEAKNGETRTGDERTLLTNVLKLRDLRVDDVSVPRADIVAIEAKATLDETLETFREGAHSRLPVYRENLDDPVGVVHLKDLALSCGFSGRPNSFALEDHMRPLLVVPPSMRVDVLLQRMRATRRHMALVIDEYGGVDGLATIEDVIEQIVGEIDDEHDDAEGPLWVEQAPGCFLAEARAEVLDFETAAHVKLMAEGEEEEIDTLGGLVFMLSGRVPERGEVILHPDGHEIEIVDADPRRIKRLRVRLAGETTQSRPAPAEPVDDAAAAATLDGAASAEFGPRADETEADALAAEAPAAAIDDAPPAAEAAEASDESRPAGAVAEQRRRAPFPPTRPAPPREPVAREPAARDGSADDAAAV